MNLLLQAKMTVPRAPRVLIDLVQQQTCLQQMRNHELVLISAPAGYGKTTLVSSYCASLSQAISWYSLDEPDNDPRVFGQYLVASLAKALPLSTELQAKAMQGRFQQLQELLGELVLELEGGAWSATLVLDDFQQLQQPAILSALNWFLAYLPASIQCLIISRIEPQTLSRACLQKSWLRIGQAQLYWDESAVVALFQAHGHSLPIETALKLNRQIEGWVTGLKLVALNHHTDTDPELTRQSLQGREIQHYLFQEIYARQSAEFQQFLRQTSVVERFNRPLAQTLTGFEQIEAFLLQLEQQQLFFTSLGEDRQWFRYHPLLVEFLRGQLSATERQALHGQAAGWWQQQAQLALAAQHYALSQDAELIFQFLLQQGSNLFNLAHTHALSACIQSLPTSRIASSLQLTALCAWFEHVVQRKPERVQPLLAAAEQHIRAAVPREQAEIEIVAHFGSVQSSIWLEAGEVERAMPLAERAYAQYQRLPDSIFPAPLFSALSDIAVQAGDLTAALQYSNQAAEFDRSYQMFLGVFWHLHQQAAIAYYAGDLSMAERLLSHAIALVKERGLGFIPRYDTWLRSKARLCWLRLQFQQARQLVAMALSHNEPWPHEQILNQVELAHILLAQRDLPALQSLGLQLESAWFNQSHWPRMQSALEQVLVQIWSLRQDRFMLQRYLQLRLPPVHYRCPENQLFAQALAWANLTLGQFEQALVVLQPALACAGKQGLQTAYHAANLLQVAVWWQQDLAEPACQALAESLVWIGAQQAPMMILSLQHWLISPLERLALDCPQARRLVLLIRQQQNALSRSQQPEVPEAARALGLTRQEWQVLLRLTEGLSNDELCDRLHLSMNTIRSHIRRINKKIGAKTRDEAIQAALRLQADPLSDWPLTGDAMSPLASSA